MRFGLTGSLLLSPLEGYVLFITADYWHRVPRSFALPSIVYCLPSFLLIRLNTPQSWYLIIDLHGGPSSAVSAIGANATSYAHRNALLKYEFYDSVFGGSYPSDGFAFLNGWVDTILNTSS